MECFLLFVKVFKNLIIYWLIFFVLGYDNYLIICVREWVRFLLLSKGFEVVRLVVEFIVLVEKYCIIEVSVIDGLFFILEIILKIFVKIGKSRVWFFVYILFKRVLMIVLFWMYVVIFFFEVLGSLVLFKVLSSDKLNWIRFLLIG